MVKVFQLENQRVEFLDQRFYKDAEGNYFPSVTTVLDAYPKDKRLEQWLKDVGNEADNIIERAATQGTNVHNAIEKLLKGQKIEWLEFTLDEWKMILRFHEFFERFSLEVEAIEHNLVSSKLGVGGTLDLVCKLNGERWLIDFKTSSGVYDSHFVQIATYAAMWNEAYPDKRIERIGILHLRALTRTEGKNGAVQGKGWKLEEPTESVAELYDIFKHVYILWKRINPDAKPLNQVLPSEIQLKMVAPKEIKEKAKVALPFV